MTWWMWLVAGVFLLLLELLTPGFFAFFLGFGAIAVGAIVAIWPGMLPLWLELLLFTAISTVLVLLFRRRLLVWMQRHTHAPKPMDFIGETAVVLDIIAAGGVGKAELRGTVWTARNAGDTPLLPAARCRVDYVDGLTIWIRNTEED